MTLEKYKRTKSLEVDELYIEKPEHDLRLLFSEMVIYEDIYSHFLSGHVHIMDPIALTEEIPITGWQKLKIKFRSTADGNPFKYITKEFKIFKVELNEPDQNSGLRNRTYMIHFISGFAEPDLTKKVSRTYKEMKESEIVKNVCEKLLGITEYDIEDSKYPKTITVPNWRPTQLIDYCCRDAVRPGKYEATNFVFFETFDEFKFKSLDKIIEEPAQKPAMTHLLAASYKSDEKSSTRQAKTYFTDNSFDFIQSSQRGAWANRYIGVDIYNKKWEAFDYVYKDEFASQVNIDGSNKILSDNVFASVDQKIVTGPYMSEPKQYNSDWHGKHRPKRQAMMDLWENYVYIVDSDGDNRLELGVKIEFDLPSYNAHEGPNKQKKDKYLSGFYVVTSIANHFTATQHRQTVTLRKPMLKDG